MKALFVVIIFFNVIPANAAWNKIIECNNGELVVDQGDNDSMGRPTYQLVLRGAPLNYLIRAGAVEPRHVNSKGEFITWLSSYDGLFMGFISYSTPLHLPHKYRYYWVSRSYGNVLIRATIGNPLQGEEEKANWYFHGCR